MATTYKLLVEFNIGGTPLALGINMTSDEGTSNLSKQFYSGNFSGVDLSVTDLIERLLASVSDQPVIPEGLLPEVYLNDVYASYDGENEEVNLLGLANIDDKEVKFFFHKGVDNYAFGLLTDVSDLSGLPMVGDQLKEVRLAGAGFVYSSAAATVTMPQLLDALASDTARIIPGGLSKDFVKGFNIVGDFYMSADTAPFTMALPVESGESQMQVKAAEQTPAMQEAPAAAPLDPAKKWFKLEQKIGPLYISRLGFSYQSDQVSLLLAGDLNLGGLTVSLEGLGMSFPLSELLLGDIKVPDFFLNGLGLSYVKSPVEVSGTFLKTSSSPLAFNGSAVLKASDFTVSGIGSYTTVDKETSLFIYALFDKAIGGPSFFFVTGLAAGFGYNRKVRIPQIEEVEDFPLVSMALDPGANKSKPLMDILSELTNEDNPWIIPSAGDFWLAVGIKFTSFKIIESFVLLIVQFGHQVEYNILGLSVLRWPEKSQGDAIVYIELALKATFGPDSDVIAVRANITPNSYVFSADAKIQGGFAFYTWVSGQHEGDFVLSLGGYHPKFNKPAHYPDVERLALNWPISSKLTIKGELYFAMTPSYMMAGGKWEVEYKLSFLRAYISIWADMIIQWAPFQYTLDAGIRVGIEARIKVLFIKVRFKLEMGAELHIWGPPFAGEVYVDWSVFSFTIPFGSAKKQLPKSLSWNEFRKSFLPQYNEKTKPIGITIGDGIIEEYKDEATGEVLYTIVNPLKLVFKIDSAIPITALDPGVQEVLNLQGDPHANNNVSLGIRPMGVSNLSTTLTIDFKLGASSLVIPGIKKEELTFKIESYKKNVPEALWSPEALVVNNKKPTASRVIKDTLAGLTIKPVERPVPNGTPKFDLNGKFVKAGPNDPFSWTSSILTTGPDNESYTDIKTKIKSSVSKLNSAIEIFTAFCVLDEEERPPQHAADNIIWEEWVDELQDDPVISGVGELPQYALTKGS